MLGQIIRVFLFIFLVFVFHYSSFSQEFGYKNYNVADGLASSTVYCIEKDNTGRLWFGTQYGVSIFNGSSFENIGRENGLNETDVFLMFNDSKNRIWFISFSNDLFYYEKGIIRKVNQNREGDKNPFFSHIKNIREDNKGNIWFCGSRIYKVNHDSLVEISRKGSPRNYDITINENTLKAVTRFKILNIENDSLPGVNNAIMDSERKTKTYRGVCKVNNQYYFYAENSVELVEYNVQGDPYLLAKTILSTPVNRIKYLDGSLWILTNGNGAYKINTNTNDTLHFLNNKSVSDVITDDDNNTWITTLDAGVFKINFPLIKVYTAGAGLVSGNILSIEKNLRGDIWAGSGSALLYFINKNKIEIIKLTDDKRNSRILNINSNNSDLIYCSADNGFYAVNQLTGKQIHLIDSLGAFKCVSIINKDELFSGSSSALYLVNTHDNYPILKTWYKRITALARFDNNTAVAGTLDGIYFARKDSAVLFKQKNYDLEERVNYILKDNRGIVWVATHSAGLFAFNGKEKINITASDGLLSNTCKHIYADAAAQTIWLSTNKGVNKIEIQNLEEKRYIISPFTTEDGLPSDEINQITVIDKKVWIATTQGIAVINDTYRQQIKKPELFIRAAAMQDSVYLNPHQMELPYNKNSITIYYEGISLSAGKKLFYKYRLLGADEKWIITKNNNISFASLQPGYYTFQIAAMHPLGNLQSEVSQLIIIIKKPFWKKWSFALAGTLIAGLVIYLIYRRRWKRLKRDSALKTHLLESEITAIRSQMNPHFIFNSLNAIQDFVFKNEKEIANEYLSSFSKLMRMVLDNSNSNFITVTKEIEFLEHYLELEKLRLNNTFDYSIEVDKNIQPDITTIPGMIVQPIVENAILHGISKKESKGTIRIKFSGDEHYLVCIIQDNGAGRNNIHHPLTQNKNGHKAFGMNAIDERIKILNTMQHFTIKMALIDITDNYQNPAGTLVLLSITQNNKIAAS